MSHVMLYIYLMSLVNNINIALGIFVFIMSLLTAVAFLVYALSFAPHEARQRDVARRFLRWLIPLFIVCALVEILIPPEKTMTILVAGAIGQEVLATKQAAVVGDKADRLLDTSMDLLQSWIDKQAKEQSGK